jgi:hypothetical protein
MVTSSYFTVYSIKAIPIVSRMKFNVSIQKELCGPPFLCKMLSRNGFLVFAVASVRVLKELNTPALIAGKVPTIAQHAYLKFQE